MYRSYSSQHAVSVTERAAIPPEQDLEVRSSHVGSGVKPAAIVAISDRLALPEGEWRPFKPPALLRGLFPDPVWWTPATTG